MMQLTVPRFSSLFNDIPFICMEHLAYVMTSAKTPTPFWKIWDCLPAVLCLLGGIKAFPPFFNIADY